MASRRDLIDADDYARHRTVAALVRGDARDTEEVPRRPNTWLIAGVVVALLIGAAAAVTSFLSDRAPSGWNAEGSLVVDKQTGASYVVQGGTLHSAPTLTAALLAGGRRQPVLVAHTTVLTTPMGEPLPGRGTPPVPPEVPAPVDLTACLTAPNAVDVFGTPPRGEASPATGLLVRAAGSNEMALISGRARYRVDDASVIALGYNQGQLRDVPRAWFDLVPRGTDMVLQRPAPGSGGDVPGIGSNGQTVTSAETGRRYLVSGGALRPLANRTTELLVPPSSATVPDAAISAAPVGPPAGLLDVPSEPPAVPPREQDVTPCVSSADGTLTLTRSVADDGTRATPGHVVRSGSSQVAATWHFIPGRGALIGPPDVNAPRPPGDQRPRGIVVVDGGSGYLVIGDDQVLRALGYDRRVVTPVGLSWFSLLDTGVPLIGKQN